MAVYYISQDAVSCVLFVIMICTKHLFFYAYDCMDYYVGYVNCMTLVLSTCLACFVEEKKTNLCMILIVIVLYMSDPSPDM